ncbi:MAG: hypothetical protein GXX89_10465, partial [Clostridiales bacterium]|nr:hypothetical protein [Clostridiales bacterium]
MKRKTSVSIVILAAAVFLLITAYALFPGLGGADDKIVLPSSPPGSDTDEYPTGASPELPDETPIGGITPQNVLQVISVMKRSDNYNQKFIISIGSDRAETAEVWYLDGKIKAVFNRPFETKNVIISGGDIYIWYDGDDTCYSGPLGEDFTPDDELNIPTYEDLLASDGFRIEDARYLSLEELGEYCIYVEARNEDGARERFWISCATGLLVKYEAEEDGNVTYSMLQTFIESPVTS